MNVSGERIIVFGDSTSKHGADSSPEIWDVDQDSSRISGQPGDLLASMLLEQGASAVRVNARVGRSAHNFWGREDTNSLLGSDQAFAPTKVIMILGTNDIGLSLDVDQADMERIRDFYKGLGAEVWGVGPWAFPGDNMNQGAMPVADMMKDVFGARFIDPRPITATVGRAGDGVHFGAESARQTAMGLLQLVQSASSFPWKPLLLGLGAAILGAVAWNYHKKGKIALPSLGDLGERCDPNLSRAAFVRCTKRQQRALGDGAELAAKPKKPKKQKPADFDPDYVPPEIKFRDLMANAETVEDIEIAEDFAMAQGIKLRSMRSLPIAPFDPDPTKPGYGVSWGIERQPLSRNTWSKDDREAWAVDYTIVLNGKVVTIEGNRDGIGWRRGTFEEVQREAAAEGLAIAKAMKPIVARIKAGHDFVSPALVRKKAVDAMYDVGRDDLKKRPELFGSDAPTRTKLWRFAMPAGVWRLEKAVSADEAEQWLGIFQKDEPKVVFKLSKVKPRKDPPHDTSKRDAYAALERERQQIFQTLNYAGNTREQVTEYHARIKELDAKIRTLDGLRGLEAARRRPEQETRTTDDGPGSGPPYQGKLQIGRKNDSYKDLSWAKVIAEAKKEAKSGSGNKLFLSMHVKHAPNDHTPFAHVSWDPMDTKGAIAFAKKLVDDKGAMYSSVEASAERPHMSGDRDPPHGHWTLASFEDDAIPDDR